MGRAFEYRKAAKMKRWGHMARTFTKIGKQIAVAVKAGGPEPEMNPALRAIIATAKRENMPKDNIDRAIKNAMGKDQSDYKTMTYEGYGPHGIAVFVDKKTEGLVMEEMILDLIDYGVEDEFDEDEEEGTITIYGDPKSFSEIQKHLESEGFEIVSAEFTYIPNDLKDVTDEQRETLDKMVERLEDFDDVQNVYTNMKPAEGDGEE